VYTNYLKKATIIFSFILITVFSVGSYFLHQLYLKSYKKEFKAYISKYKQRSAFSTITINPSELYINSANIIWEDEYKEVIYNGVLYDVVSVKGKGLTIVLTVVSDHQEMELKKEFASLFDVSSNQKTKGPFDLLKNFMALKYLAANSDFCFNNCVFSLDNLASFKSIQINSPVINLDTPPPQFFAI
jgi:hypothetical protein